MKKAVCILSTIMLLVLTLPALAVNAKPGQTVTVNINVTTSGAYASIGIDYDSSVLEFVSASGGNVAPRSGSGRFIFGSGTSSIGSASGSVTFRVKDSAMPGTYNVRGYKVECYDTSLSDCSCSVSGGSVVVTAEAPDPTFPPITPDPGKTTPQPTPKSTKNPYNTPTSTDTMGTYTLVTLNEDDEEETFEVEIVEWGLVHCRVLLNGIETEVNTMDLVLSDKVPDGHQLAVIYAPNKGKAALRKAENTGSKQLESCNTGVIVPVLEEGKKMSRINYLGKTGYILNTSLHFYAPCEGEGEGLIGGKNASDANMRLNKDNGSLKIAKLQNGTKVCVVKAWKEWYEIDYAGLHGFVPKKLLDMIEE